METKRRVQAKGKACQVKFQKFNKMIEVLFHISRSWVKVPPIRVWWEGIKFWIDKTTNGLADEAWDKLSPFRPFHPQQSTGWTSNFGPLFWNESFSDMNRQKAQALHWRHFTSFNSSFSFIVALDISPSKCRGFADFCWIDIFPFKRIWRFMRLCWA